MHYTKSTIKVRASRTNYRNSFQNELNWKHSQVDNNYKLKIFLKKWFKQFKKSHHTSWVNRVQFRPLKRHSYKSTLKLEGKETSTGCNESRHDRRELLVCFRSYARARIVALTCQRWEKREEREKLVKETCATNGAA